jgi:hypothetical protein
MPELTPKIVMQMATEGSGYGFFGNETRKSETWAKDFDDPRAIAAAVDDGFIEACKAARLDLIDVAIYGDCISARHVADTLSFKIKPGMTPALVKDTTSKLFAASIPRAMHDLQRADGTYAEDRKDWQEKLADEGLSVKAAEQALREDVAKLASANPSLRKHLLPLLRKEAAPDAKSAAKHLKIKVPKD